VPVFQSSHVAKCHPQVCFPYINKRRRRRRKTKLLSVFFSLRRSCFEVLLGGAHHTCMSEVFCSWDFVFVFVFF
ncbi:mCG140578, partial [Mus musculus]